MAVLAWLAGPAWAEGRPQPGWPRVVLVLDASGSMWAKVEGRTRIEVAREAIRKLVGDWDPRAELGLVAYGHRSRHDCADIQTLLPIAPADPAAFVEAVEGIRPVGMTPLAASLEQAARLLESDRRPATVILVSDGNETCGRDPCAAARTLSEKGVDFTTHVIGFDVTAQERVQLQCVADATGGLFLDAHGAAGLSSALRAAMDDIALRATSPPLWMAASLSPGSAPLTEPLDWRITPLDASGRPDADGAESEVHTPTLSRRLRAGRYRVQVSLDGVSASKDLSVDPTTHASHILSLDAADLSVVAVDREGRPLESGVAWRVERANVGSHDPKGAEAVAPIEREGGATRFLLSEGRYAVTSLYDGDRVARVLVVRPGQVLRKRFQFGIGGLALRAVMADGWQPLQQPVRWQVRDARGELLREDVRPSTLYTLDTGRYSVEASRGEARAAGEFEVRSGVTVIGTLDLEAGELGLYGKLPAPGAVIMSPVEWTLTGSDGRVHALSAASPRVVLPAGVYRISAHRGEREGQGTVEVRPGGEATVGLVLQAPGSAVARVAP